MADFIDNPCPCTNPGLCPHYGIFLFGKVWRKTRQNDDEGRQWRRMLVERALAPKASPALSLLQKGVNFARAAVAHALGGFQTVSDEERARRLSICQACPHYVNEGCNKCGCPMPSKEALLDKLRWAEQHCPLVPPKW
jgi:hypothetical protein